MEIATTASGLLLPRFIIQFYGSEVNGLICSITQFLGYLSFFQLGVGGVVRAALYKPLADNDRLQISKVVKASDSFYRKITILSVFYIILLFVVYPFINENSFKYIYIASLVVILGLDTIAQYAFGFSKRQVLYADQRSYVFDFARTVAICLNVIFSVLLIYCGFGIHLVKICSAVFFVLQPVFINLYTIKKYQLISDVEPDSIVLKQRFLGLYYSLADFVHKKTDILVLTFLSTLKEISVYSIYSLIVVGINQIVSMATYPLQAALGNMYAKQETEKLNQSFRVYVLLIHSCSFVLFTATLALINTFVEHYTVNITDVNYYRPVFSFLIVSAEMLYCLRQPYQAMVLVAGHFKETQAGAVIEAVINLVISIILVFKYGLIGVAIGTITGMIYRTFDLIHYLHSHILFLKYSDALKRYAITFLEIYLIFYLFNRYDLASGSILRWIIVAFALTSCLSVFILLFNYIFYREEMNLLINGLKNLFHRKITAN